MEWLTMHCYNLEPSELPFEGCDACGLTLKICAGRAIAFDPGNLTFLRNRGNCRRLQGSFSTAVEDFDRCAARTPPPPPPFLPLLPPCLLNRSAR